MKNLFPPAVLLGFWIIPFGLSQDSQNPPELFVKKCIEAKPGMTKEDLETHFGLPVSGRVIYTMPGGLWPLTVHKGEFYAELQFADSNGALVLKKKIFFIHHVKHKEDPFYFQIQPLPEGYQKLVDLFKQRNKKSGVQDPPIKWHPPLKLPDKQG